jgi:hypothetical protein
VGIKNHPTGTDGLSAKTIYKEFSFAEVSGMPVQTFKYLNAKDNKLYETSGRLLISGDGNQQDDNAVYGETCMYLTVVDDVASGSCKISNSEEKFTCVDCNELDCYDAGWTGSIGEAIDGGCVVECPCEAFMSMKECCERACGPYYSRRGLVNGYQVQGFSSFSECTGNCISCEGEFPWRHTVSIEGGAGCGSCCASIYEGEFMTFSTSARFGGVMGWYELSNSAYEACDGSIPCYLQGRRMEDREGRMLNPFTTGFCKDRDEYWYVAILGHEPATGNPPLGIVGCDGLYHIAAEKQICIKNGGDVEITWPTEPVNNTVKRGQSYNLSVSAQGAQPIYYAWFSGANVPITPYPPGEIWAASVTVGPLTESACYYAKAWNGGCTSYSATSVGFGSPARTTPLTPHPFANEDTSANICIEVVDQTDEIQCCLDPKTREFEITGSNCKITSIRGYELWTDLMGSYASDYRHGRIITPEVTSRSDKSWNTKWHETSPSPQIGPAISGICYNSGTHPNTSQNNQWCSNITVEGDMVPCFTTSGCPDKIVYEVITHESTSNSAYGKYFGGSNRNKIIERKQHFEDDPLGQTGHLYVQYASSASYTGDCGCKHLTLNWAFPPYDNGLEFSNYASCGSSCMGTAPIGVDVCCSMGAEIDSTVRSFTPDIGQIVQVQHFTGCVEWSSAFTGSLNFIWSGQTPTGLGSYSRSPNGNLIGETFGLYKGVGAANRNNDDAIFTGDVNMWDIRIVENTVAGIEGSGSYNYTGYYLSGSSELVTFTRTLKENYYNIRSDSNRTLINLSSYVPASARYVADYARTRTVSLYAADQTNFIFAVNSVDKTDSHSAAMGSNGFTRHTAGTELWCHQSGAEEPFKIFNGWVNTCYPFVTAATSGACYAAGPGEQDGMPCPCEANDVTMERIGVATDMTSYMDDYGEIDSRGSKYLDLTFVMESGDVLYYEQMEYSGWNSFCHGHFLAVNQSTGDWENFTGCAEIPPFQTFVNGQEV